MEQTYKKRHRIPASCLVCRKRKSKCDRVRPICGSCKKKLISHLCFYEETSLFPHPHPDNYSNNNAAIQTANLHGQPGVTYIAVNSSMMPIVAPLGSAFQVENSLVNPIQHMYNPSSPWPTTPNPIFNQQNQQLQPQLHLLQGQLSQSQSSFSVQPGQHPQFLNNAQPLNEQVDPNNSNSARQYLLGSSTSSVQPHQLSLQSQSKTGQDGYCQSSNASDSRVSISRLSLDSSNSFSSHSRYPSMTTSYSLSDKPLLSPPKANFPSNELVNIPSQDYREVQNTPSLSEQKESKSPTYVVQKSVPTSQHGTSYESVPTAPAIISKSDLQKSNSSNETSKNSPNTTNAKNLKDSIIKFKLNDASTTPCKKRKFLDQQDPVTLKHPYVTVAIGTRLLKIELEDKIGLFDTPSNCLLVEGHSWQQQGPLSYIGLTKTDPFVNLVRNFTLDLFKTEQFSKYVSRKKNKQYSSLPYSINGSSSTLTDNSVSDLPNRTLLDIKEEIENQSSADEDDGEEGDVFEEDALIVTKIKPDSSKNNDDLQTGFPMKPIMQLHGTHSLHLLHSNKEVYYSFVEDSILLILPRKSAITTAVYMFFRYVQPLIPFLHELTFLHEFRKLFRYSKDESLYHTKMPIKSEKLQNLAGMLLLVIRLGYMTLIPTSDTDVRYTRKEQELIKDVTRFKSDHYMGVVNLCIPEEKVRTKSTFLYVQCLSLLYFYRSVAPNDCLGLSGVESQLLFGSIVNHALSIGLNRDPTVYKSIKRVSKKPYFVELWRNLWLFIINTDTDISIYCGTPLKLPDIFIGDVKPPLWGDLADERKYQCDIQEVNAGYRRIVHKISSLKNRPTIVEILSETSHLESKFLEIFGENFFRDYVCKPCVTLGDQNDPDIMKVDKFIKFISIRVNLTCLYYMIVLHYERKADNNDDPEMGAGTELFKILIKSAVQVVYIMTYVLDNSQELFGRYFDWILTARIERSMIKTHSFSTGMFTRVLNLMRTLKCKESQNPGTNPSELKEIQARMEIVQNLFGMAMTEAELFVGNFRALSKTHINSYKIYVMAYFGLKQCMENPEPFIAGFAGKAQLFFHNGSNLLNFLTLDELRSISELCEEFRIAKIDLLRRKRSHINSKNSQVSKSSGGSSATTNSEKSGSSFQSGSASSDTHQTPLPTDTTTETNMNSFTEDDLDSMADEFDALLANRTMYGNDNTVNTYGLLQPRHMDAKFQKEVFDSQSMIGNDELFQLFEMYGDLD